MMDNKTGGGVQGDGQLQPAWVTEQISLFAAAIGVKIRFAPIGLGGAGFFDGLSEFCSAIQPNDGYDPAGCQAWHECQTEMIMRSTRAVRIRCPMELDYLWAPVAKEGEFYGFLYSEPVGQAGHPDGNGRERKLHRVPGNGSLEAQKAVPRKMAPVRRCLRVKAARSDGLLFLLELMGQRWGTRFHQERQLPTSLDPNEALVKRAEAVLCGLYHEKISTRDIAQRLHVSESYLCHSFRRVTGGTLRQHLNQLRFEEACRLLKEYPRLSVGEVAFAAGFQSLSRFTEQFRRRKMASPGKWRRLED